jgi:hypothetical protein
MAGISLGFNHIELIPAGSVLVIRSGQFAMKASTAGAKLHHQQHLMCTYP